MMTKKMTRKGYAYGSVVRSPMQPGNMGMSANPMMEPKDKMGMTGMADGGRLKSVPAANKGLGNMGYMSYGGKMKKKG